MEPPHLKLSEIRMYQQAAEDRWPIKTEQREAIVMRLLRIIAHPESKDRAVIAASRTLAAMDAVNVTNDKKRRAESDRNRFLAVAERLGITHAVGKLSEGDSGAGDRVVDGTAVVRTGEGCTSEEGASERSQPDSDPASEELEQKGEEPAGPGEVSA